jgi:hypothetical protein
VPAKVDHFYDTARHPRSLDFAWRAAEGQLPEGWTIVEVCRLYGPERISERWYAAATDPRRPAGEFVEAEDSTPVRVLLALARHLHERRHRVGRPPEDRLPPPLPRPAGRESPYRSPDAGSPIRAAS